MEFVFTGNTSSDPIKWNGGPGVVIADGTWGSGTLTLQARRAGSAGAWIAVGSNVTFTANGLGGFTLGDCDLRLTMTGSTTPSVTARILNAES